MKNGKYVSQHFVTDANKSAEQKLSAFLNRSEIEPDKIISISHCFDFDNDRVSILLTYIESVNPYRSGQMF